MALVLSQALASLAAAAPAKDEQAEAQAILDKAIKAVGGEERLTKLTSFTVKTRCKYCFHEGGTGIQTVHLSYDSSRRVRMESTLVYELTKANVQDANIDFIINGSEAWVSLNGKPRAMSEEEAARQMEFLDRSLRSDLGIRQLPLLKGKGYNLTPLGDSKIGDHRSVGIKVSREGQSDIRLYFDKDTGLPVKRSSLRKEPAKTKNPSTKVEVLFDNYKETGGIKYPAKLTFLEDDREVRTEEITEFTIVEKFDEKTFAKPE
jgi:hypothetical protein